MGESGKRPWWLPTGGWGAMLFGVAMSLFLGGTTLFYFNRFSQESTQEQTLKDQEELIFRENQKLRSQVDKLQSDLAEKGSILLNREQILQQTTESLKQVQKEKEEKERLALPDAGKLRHDLFQQITDLCKAQPALADCKVLEDGLSVVIRINNNLLFSPGETTVTPKGIEILKVLVSLLKQVPIDPNLELQAHTDDLAPSAALATSYPTNWELSARRACAVLRVLVEDANLPAKTLKAVGMGDARPAVPNDTKENRSLNRRLEIWMVPKGTAAAVAERY